SARDPEGGQTRALRLPAGHGQPAHRRHRRSAGPLRRAPHNHSHQKGKSVNKQNLAPSPRGAVLAILGVITLGVAILSVAVSYDILEPRFGAWAVPTVGALDALWVVFQATEILAGNNRRRARRVQAGGLALTAVNAAIPTVHLVMSGPGSFDLA